MRKLPPDSAAPPPCESDGALAVTVRRCGVATLLAWLLLAPLTLGIAVVTPFDSRTPEEIAVLRKLVDYIPLLPEALAAGLHQYLAGHSFLAPPRTATVVFVIPLFVATGAMLVVLRRVYALPQAVTRADVARLSRFAVAFAAVNLLLYPMFTQDFWYSVAWGRMIAAGENPYYTYFAAEAVADLPLYYDQSFMTYGPLWGYISALIALMGGHVVVLEYVLFKLLLLGAWVGCLSVVKRLTADRSPQDQAVAVILFGWMPMSYFLTVGEGHNDVAMVLGLMTWLYLVSRGSHLLSPWALLASALMKVVTLPLIILECLRGWTALRARRMRYVGTLAACAAASTLCVLTLARDRHFMQETQKMRQWEMFTPAQALTQIGHGLELPVANLTLARGLKASVLAILGALTGWYAWAALRAANIETLTPLLISVMLIILLVVVGHVWPWFVLWVLAPAAVARRSLAADLSVSLAIAAPFMHVYWILDDGWRNVPNASVAFYAAVGTILVFYHVAFPSPHRPHQRAITDAALQVEKSA